MRKAVKNGVINKKGIIVGEISLLPLKCERKIKILKKQGQKVVHKNVS